MYKPIEKNKIFERLHQEIKQSLIDRERNCIDLRRLQKNSNEPHEKNFWVHNNAKTSEPIDLQMFS